MDWFTRMFLRALAFQQWIHNDRTSFWNWNWAIYSTSWWLMLFCYSALLGIGYTLRDTIPDWMNPIYANKPTSFGWAIAIAIFSQVVTQQRFARFRTSPEAALEFQTRPEMLKLVWLALSGIVLILTIPMWWWLADVSSG